MALIIPPNNSSPSLDAQLGLQQTAKSTGKGVTAVQTPGASMLPATDAAGLAISETSRAQLRSLAATERNANDVIAMAQTADGALGRMGGVLSRMRELALEDADPSTAGGRDDAGLEFSRLQNQIDGIQKSATYEGRALLGAEAIEVAFEFALEGHDSDRLAATLGGFGPLTVLGSGPSASGARQVAESVVGRIDHALATIADQRARFGATVTRFAETAAAVQTARASRSGGGSPLTDASAAEELANLCKSQIFGLGPTALLAQGNQLPAQALTLLQE